MAAVLCAVHFLLYLTGRLNGQMPFYPFPYCPKNLDSSGIGRSPRMCTSVYPDGSRNKELNPHRISLRKSNRVKIVEQLN